VAVHAHPYCSVWNHNDQAGRGQRLGAPQGRQHRTARTRFRLTELFPHPAATDPGWSFCGSPAGLRRQPGTTALLSLTRRRRSARRALAATLAQATPDLDSTVASRSGQVGRVHRSSGLLRLALWAISAITLLAALTGISASGRSILMRRDRNSGSGRRGGGR
jgi:hypothetical protein